MSFWMSCVAKHKKEFIVREILREAFLEVGDILFESLKNKAKVTLLFTVYSSHAEWSQQHEIVNCELNSLNRTL